MEVSCRSSKNSLNSCPSLNDYEKSLLVQIDIEEKGVTKVAKELGKAKSTISSQHNKTFQKFTDWRKNLLQKLVRQISMRARNQNVATGQLTAFINRVEALRRRKLTDEQTDYLMGEAQRIIDLVIG